MFQTSSYVPPAAPQAFTVGDSTVAPFYVRWLAPTRSMDPSIATLSTDVENSFNNFLTAVTPGFYRFEMNAVCVGKPASGAFLFPIIDPNNQGPVNSAPRPWPSAKAIYGAGAVGIATLPTSHRGRSQVVGTRYLEAGDKVYFRVTTSTNAETCPLSGDGTTNLTIIKLP